jgi:hypothetical protein
LQNAQRPLSGADGEDEGDFNHHLDDSKIAFSSSENAQLVA